MLEEILSQKKCLKNTFSSNVKEIEKLKKIIKKKNLKHFEIIARGSSRNATEIFKYELESKSDFRVSYVYPSTVTKYKGKLNPSSIYLAVSQGGKGEDLKLVLEAAKKSGAYTVAITNEENSPLSKIADFNLYLKVGKENSMAATKTFTSEMLVLEMLALALSNEDYSSLEKITELFLPIKNKEILSFVDALKKPKNLFVLTRGKLLGVGKEVCCKLQETCFKNANCFASSDFMHGPFALVDKTFIGLFLVPNDDTKDDVLNLIKKVNENNGKTLVISSEKVQCFKQLKIKNTDNILYPFLMTFIIQLLSANLSKCLKIDADKSRNLNKYTKTI